MLLVLWGADSMLYSQLADGTACVGTLNQATEHWDTALVPWTILFPSDAGKVGMGGVTGEGSLYANLIWFHLVPGWGAREGILKMGRFLLGEVEGYGGVHETCFDHRDYWAGRLLLG